MSKELERLARDYREAKAPPHIATRIRAKVANRPVRNHGWLPVATTAVLAAAIIGLGPLIWNTAGGPDARPTTPSLTTLASINVEKPSTVSPSLSKVRTFKAPRMPAKPKATGPREQTNSLIEIFEEKDHAHT